MSIIQRSSQTRDLQLTRDCPAALIPLGETQVLKAGERVTLVQDSGLSTTVKSAGRLYRIANEDVDALGVQPSTLQFDNILPDQVNEEHIWQVLRQCYDPEINLNIVDLGLVYKMLCGKNSAGEWIIDLTMTLTAVGCGMGPMLLDDIQSHLEKIPHVGRVNLHLTFDPPWDKSRISEVGKVILGLD